METKQLVNIIESALLATSEPLSIERLLELFEDNEKPTAKLVREIIDELQKNYQDRAVELKQVATGFRFQVRAEYGPWVQKLWQERPPRYSRALLETLALIAYKQPITRGEIEEVRGVAVSSHIIKTLLERDWIKEVGHKDVPGKPALFATTRYFLDDFNLKSLAELPVLSDLKDLDSIENKLGEQLNLAVTVGASENESQISSEAVDNVEKNDVSTESNNEEKAAAAE